MSASKLKKILTDVGLSENQARVYLASLALGPERPVAIARAAGLKRTTVYPVIESLERIGLMSIQAQSFKKVYFAESPERLESLVAMRYKQLKNALGDLSALYDLKSGESAIKYYEGQETINSIYNALLQDIGPGEDYLIVSSPDQWYNFDPDFYHDFIRRRAGLDIKIRCLLLDSPVARDYKANEKTYNLRAKLFPSGISFTANIVIIPKRVLIHQLVPPAWAIVIENSNIIKTHTQLFNMIWQTLADSKASHTIK